MREKRSWFRVTTRLVLAGSVCLSAAWCDETTPVFSRTLGGSDQNDVITAIALDSAGNIVVAGNAVSPNLPVTDGLAKPGTQFSVSNDQGATWHALSNLPSGTANAFVFDPVSPGTLYAGGSNGVFKSTDGGTTWAATSLTYYAASLAIDPTRHQIIFAGTKSGIFKSTDSGATWSNVSNGIDTIGGQFPPEYITIDPFHSDTIYTHAFNADLRSSDGGQTWSAYSLPSNGNTGNRPVKPAFDPSQPGLIYAAGVGGFFRSTDDGQNWTTLNEPFPSPDYIMTVPAAPGSVWIEYGGAVYRSDDQGSTFRPVFSIVSNGGLSVNPSNPAVVLTDLYRTPDNGATVQYFGLGRRAIQISFDTSTPGRAIALALPTTSIFIAKLDPTGQNILFMRYFGGMGNDTTASMAVDHTGNFYITGQTTSSDFPVTSGVFGPTPPPSNFVLPQNPFAAKFDPNGNLVYSTFLSSGAPSAIATDSQGNANVTGVGCFLTKISPDASKTVFSTQLSNTTSCAGLAVDQSNNIVLVGNTDSPYLPWTGDGIQTKKSGPNDAVIARFGADGTLIYASYLGGSDADGASGVSLDSAGNIYVVGTTFSKDFPVTSGAFQSELGAGCPTSFNAILTRVAGSPNTVWDNVFLVKLDPTATSVLYSTYLGGTCQDQSNSVSVDSNGNVWISGASNSSDLPEIWPIFTPAGANTPPELNGYYGFVARAASSGAWFWRSSFLPPYFGMYPVAVSDSNGNVYVGGGRTALMEIGPH